MIQISDTQEVRLNALASKAGKPVTEVIDLLMTEYIQDMQDAIEADTAYAEFLESGGKTISLEQLKKENGL